VLFHRLESLLTAVVSRTEGMPLRIKQKFLSLSGMIIPSRISPLSREDSEEPHPECCIFFSPGQDDDTRVVSSFGSLL